METARRFHFFEKHLICAFSEDRAPVVFESVVDSAGDDDYLWILESSGRVNALYRPHNDVNSRDMLLCHSSKAFEFEGFRLFACHDASSLIIVGKDEESDSMLKFNTYKVSSQHILYGTDILQFVQSVPVFLPSQGLELDNIQTIAVSSCTNLAAVGTANGTVYLYYNYLSASSDGSCSSHTLTSLRLSDFSRDRTTGYIRSIHICLLGSGIFGLNVCCEDVVFSFRLDPKPELLSMQLIESSFESSCTLGSGQFGVFKSGGMIDIYNSDGSIISRLKGNGRCTSMTGYKGYIAIASVDCKGSLDSSYSTTLVAIHCRVPGMDFIAYSQHIPIVFRFELALGSLFVLARSGSSSSLILFELREKGIYDRLQILIRKRLFAWAISTATLEHRPISECEEIHKIHANWLYDKGRYDGAVDAYCKAGSSVEPGYVLARLTPLTSKLYLYKYLINLHERGKATSIHTIVLMRVLQSLFEDSSNNVASSDSTSDAAITSHDCHELLSRFLSTFGESEKDSIREALYDCRSSGGFNFARAVALAQQNHNEYIDILVEDFHDYGATLDYLQSTSTQVTCNAILKHGRRLVRHNPGAILSFIRRIGDSMPKNNCSFLEAFVPTFCMEDLFLTDMLGSYVDNNSLLIFSTRLHLLLDQYAGFQISASRDLTTDLHLGSGSTSGTHLDSRSGTCGTPLDNNDASMAVCPNTIPGGATISSDAKYTDSGSLSGNFDTAVLEDRLWKLLNGNTQLAGHQLIALLLCLVYNYQRGANSMAIKMGYYHLPLVLAGMRDDGVDTNTFDLLNHALSYGYNEPTLWVGTLSLLLSSPNDISELLRVALQHIQTHNLLSFASVLTILQRNSHLRFGDVKDYLRREFRQIGDLLHEYERDISQDKADCQQMNRDLQRLQHSYVVINNSNCSRCELCLEMPSLHFYCQHSFHTYCIGSDGLCPKCGPIANEGGYGVDSQKRLEHQDNFFKFLSGATDPFVYMTQQLEWFAFSQA
ncbi:vacuolar protein sorting-associated protein 11 [Babesia bovis T2Bo]|uniref:vacuolar protein sorting-associated protein 11 n=1 Tax=Babesia bovis T2Bo TaxID=484906 RepID=UPI001C35FD15|nr:vacuolar protein sorting-associated protein 11 [Babesia bovis T2Bo]EDO05505.2 vacuolar protein sorting-associated protein 11 [Babesia bovis T2Bo]